MIFKAILLVVLLNSVLIEGIPYCCPDPDQNCTDASFGENLDCKYKYILLADDPTIKYTHDKKDLILNDEVMPPNKYCYTFSDSQNDEGFIVCYDEIDQETDTSKEICTFLEIVSVFFIALTIAIYLIFPKVLHLQDICILYMITGIAIAYLTLVIINLSGHIPPGACEFLAYMLYFFFMFCFFWLNVLCFHIWREVVQPNCLASIKKWKIVYHVYGFGAPLVAIWLVSLIQFGNFSGLETIHPGIGEIKCWFKSGRENIIYFIGPVSILLFVNIIYFVWTTVELWNRSKHCTKTKVFKYRLRMYVKLFFIMGITWIFEILSLFFEETGLKWLWIITDTVNALQGVIIFLVLVVFRKTIKRALANRGFCRLRLPPQWKNEADSECEELDEDIGLETNKMTKMNLNI